MDSLHLAYQAADEQVRRLLNQALFTQIFLKADGSVERVAYTEGIGDLLVEGSVGMADRGVGAEEGQGGAVVVGTAEGRRHEGRTGTERRGYRRRSVDHGWNVKRLVEVMGLEPTTSALRTLRSTGLSYTPDGRSG